MKYFNFLAILIASLAYGAQNSDYPWLEGLDPGEGYQESGAKLIKLKPGLNPLESISGEETILLIAVHGGRSPGFEWIYPLQTLNKKEILTYFYRWNDRGCSLPAAEDLLALIVEEIKSYPELKKIILMGHSYGGVLVSSLVETWEHPLPIEIHTIAAPLGGFMLLNTVCDYRPPTHLAENVTFNQWRTQQHLDGAFKGLKEDPQVINLKGSQVVRLAETYRGRRLGHNWSISWVADRLDQSSDVE